MSEKGWIKLHRSIMEHWIYQEKPFTKFQAWADILLNVNHKDNKVLFEGSLIEIKRGQMLTSEVKLANRWGWSRKKTRNFLKMLEDEGMIKRTVIPNKGILIFVINYDLYQNGTTEDTTERIENTEIDEIKEQQKIQQRNNSGTTEEQLRNTNKNEKNDKNNTVCMYSENLKEIVSLLEQNIGIIPPVLIDEINEYSNIFSADMFREAIKIAANKKKRHVNYVLGVLRQWKDNNIITINDLEALRREKELEKEQRTKEQEKDNKQYTKSKNRFHNFEQRTSKYTAEELEEIARRKREEYYKKVVLGGNQDDK